MALDTSLFNTQQYKVRIKGKVKQSREKSSAHSYTSVWLLLKREPSGRPRLLQFQIQNKKEHNISIELLAVTWVAYI